MTKKHFVMNFIFIDMVVAGTLCGYACHKYQIGDGWEMLVAGVLTAVSVFVGMILAFMVADDRTREKKVRAEIEFQKQLQTVVMNERVNCAKVAVNMAKAMADRVANTLISKYVDGLNDAGKRKSVVDGVNQVMEDEVRSLTKALFDELQTQSDLKEKT